MHTRNAGNADATLWCPECGDNNGISSQAPGAFRKADIFQCWTCRRYFVAVFKLCLVSSRNVPVAMRWLTFKAYQTEVFALISGTYAPSDDQVLACIKHDEE